MNYKLENHESCDGCMALRICCEVCEVFYCGLGYPIDEKIIYHPTPEAYCPKPLTYEQFEILEKMVEG